MRRISRVLLLLVIAPLALRAQTPYLVKDINAIANAHPTSSMPYNFFRFGSRVYFAATTSFTGTQLWSTDGTEAGTVQVGNVSTRVSSFPSRFIVLNGKLLFNASDTQGEELWITDGTSAGTRLLADINSGYRSSAPGDRIVYHGQMIFSADDGVDGRELWITDGTPVGTRFFKDLVPGPNGSDPSSFVAFNGLVYFSAGDALWKSDGTESGTVKVKAAVDVYDLTVVGSRLFFVGVTDVTGGKLWVSDGAEAGTHAIMDAAAGLPISIWSHSITPFGDRILFAASDVAHGSELWISDGTAAGTHIVRDLYPGPSGSFNTPSIAVVGDTVFFSAFTPSTGQGIWKTDGTEAGTTLVRSLVPGSDGSGASDLVAAGDKVYFTASGGGGDRTLWVTDGTAAGTRQVKPADARLTVGVARPATYYTTVGPTLTNIDGIIYFAGANVLNGYEPWKSDGTDAGTFMIANVATDLQPSSEPRNLTAAGDFVYFDAWDGFGTITPSGGTPRSLWRSDGTPEGTVELTDSPVAGYTGAEYTPAGRSLFFYKNGLWMSDGTREGTMPATAFTSRFPGKPTISFVQDDKIFVSVQLSSTSELWVTAAARTAPAFSLGAPSGYGYTDLAGRVMYFAGKALWTTDGTRAGTYAVVPDLGDQTPSYPVTDVVAGGFLYFVAPGGGATKLWKSDGTFEGTVVVKTLSNGAGNFVLAGRNLYFISGGQLWITDGTEAGTRVLPAFPFSGTITAVGDGVVFTSTDSAHGDELWGSDGTPAGTRLIRDIYAGVSGSHPSNLASVDGLVYFTADDGLHGSEMWVTDGTPEGTKLVADIEPGVSGSYPGQYVKVGGRLFFTASSSATGTELWALPLSPTPRLAINDIRIPEGDSGTTNARFTVTLSAASAQSVTVEYATSDGSALAGSDYDAASGRLTFAPGETSQSVDVPVRGNVVPQNNRTFFVTLRNPAGATLVKPTGFAIIEDDDQIADVALTLDFANLNDSNIVVNATNNGPRTATNLKVTSTVTPADVAASTCTACQAAPQMLAPGATARAFEYRWFGQQYHTVTVTAHQRDPQPSNNSVAWISNNYVAMDALYLTPGSDANVWFFTFQNVSSVSIESSNPAVISVPASVAFTPTPGFKPATFVARGVAAGTATIRVFTPGGAIGTLTIDVVAPGTKPRWPGAINVDAGSNSPVSFDKPVIFSVYTVGTVPHTGETATGLVTFTSSTGQELARTTLTPSGGVRKVPVHAPDLGSQQVKVTYAGDANFLSMSTTSTITSSRGSVTVTTAAERIGTSATVHVRVTGSPMAAPTGTITISEPGIIPSTQVSLTASVQGVAQADVTLTNVTPGTHTLVIAYSGDARYNALTQNTRLLEMHRRAAGQ